MERQEAEAERLKAEIGRMAAGPMAGLPLHFAAFFRKPLRSGFSAFQHFSFSAFGPAIKAEIKVC
jgi:hypothetical protein